MTTPKEDATLAALPTRTVGLQRNQTAAQNRLVARDLFWHNIRAAAMAVALMASPLIHWFGLTGLLSPRSGPPGGDHAAVGRAVGMISADARANAEDLNRTLWRALDDEDATGVVVLIDAPGGSAVQAALIRDRIGDLRDHSPERPVWSVGVERMTSGACLVAAAAEPVCVSPAPLTGSIGVVYASRGLDRVLDAVGVERRLFSAGGHKDRLDRFSALDSDDRARMSQVLDRVHARFIEAVTAGRGERVAATPEGAFSGDFRVGILRTDGEIEVIERRLLVWHRTREASRRLEAIPGVGVLTATAVVAAMGDPQALRSGRELAARLGVAPRHVGTGGQVRLSGISKRGDRYLRTVLIHGARAAITHAKAPSPWLARPLERRPGNVASMALANNNARTMRALPDHDRHCERDPGCQPA